MDRHLCKAETIYSFPSSTCARKDARARDFLMQVSKITSSFPNRVRRTGCMYGAASRLAANFKIGPHWMQVAACDCVLSSQATAFWTDAQEHVVLTPEKIESDIVTTSSLDTLQDLRTVQVTDIGKYPVTWNGVLYARSSCGPSVLRGRDRLLPVEE